MNNTYCGFILCSLQGHPISVAGTFLIFSKTSNSSKVHIYFAIPNYECSGNSNQRDSGQIGLHSTAISKNCCLPNEKSLAVSYTSKLIATVSTLMCWYVC